MSVLPWKMIWFPAATMENYHIYSDLKQQKFAYSSESLQAERSLKELKQDDGIAGSFLGLHGRFCFLIPK